MREHRTFGGRQSISPNEYFGMEQDDSYQPGPIARYIRAAGEGILPVVILAAMIGLFWEASVIGRVFTAPYGIDMIQRTEMVTAGGGLVVTLIVYLISTVRTLQGVRMNQRAGAQVEAMITLAFLIASAIMTLMPLFIALASPQHPAP